MSSIRTLVSRVFDLHRRQELEALRGGEGFCVTSKRNQEE